MSTPLITLTTDFGWTDSYVAQMKGVILQRCPEANLVDLTHQIPPQGVSTAAQFIKEAFSTFPKHSVHLVVVDPGVGTNRKLLAIEWPGGKRCVGPDNGVFTQLLVDSAPEKIVSIEPHRLEGKNLSRTFHGRDIMAPAAAELAQGMQIDELGTSESLSNLTLLPPQPKPQFCSKSNCYSCHVQHVDHFGNAILTLPAAIFALPYGAKLDISSNEKSVLNSVEPVETYAHKPAGEAVILVGSQGFWEIAVVNGNAASQLQLARGLELSIKIIEF